MTSDKWVKQTFLTEFQVIFTGVWSIAGFVETYCIVRLLLRLINNFATIYVRVELTYRVGQKLHIYRFSTNYANKCVPIKLVLLELSVTHVVSHKHTTFRLFLNILSAK